MKKRVPPPMTGARWHRAALSVGFLTTAALSWTAVHVVANHPDMLEALPASVARYVEATICQLQMFVFVWCLIVMLLEWWEARRHLTRDPADLLRTADDAPPLVHGDAAGLAPDGSRTAILDVLLLHFGQDQRRRTALLQLGIWALPILGFIGTVDGITGAIVGLEKNMANAEAAGMAAGSTRAGMAAVMEGMKYAFDTTMVGLVLMIPLVILSTVFRGELETMYAAVQQRVLIPPATAPLDRAAFPPGIAERPPEPEVPTPFDRQTAPQQMEGGDRAEGLHVQR